MNESYGCMSVISNSVSDRYFLTIYGILFRQYIDYDFMGFDLKKKNKFGQNLLFL